MNRKQKRVCDLIRAAPHMTADDVAKTLRLQRRYVSWVARRFGLKLRHARKRLDSRDYKRIESMARAKVPDEDIARRIGFAADTVQRARLSLGIRMLPPRAGPLPRARQIEIVRMHLHGGYSYGQIAKIAGVSRGSVAGMVFRARRQGWDLSESVETEVEAV